MLLGLLLLIVGSVLSVPQGRNPGLRRKAACPRPGKEFLDLLPEDFNDDEYNALLDVFTRFLNVLPLDEDYDTLLDSFEDFLVVKKLEARGEFVDFENKQCTPKKVAYKLEDPEQCDKYWECSKQGELTEFLCEDGLVYDHPGRSCNHIQRVECAKRTKFQPAQPTEQCPRLNGFYHDEDDIEKCDQYVTCRNGIAVPDQCSTGLVWSPFNLACTLPNLSKRPKCAAAARAKTQAEFVCPETKTYKFGSYNTHPHPKDCGKFYICLSSGDFNRASCEKPKVFNKATGQCTLTDLVEDECKDYYEEEDKK